MAGTQHEEELRRLEAEAALTAAEAGVDPGALAETLAGAETASMGQRLQDRYAAMGARWLSDPVPSRLDGALIDRLSRHGFDADTLRQIRVHRGLRAQSAATALGARAFALGERDIFFGTGEFDPSSQHGRAVIAHEVAHVAPPSVAGSGAFDGMAAPLLNERKRGDEDEAGEEAHELQARRAEQMVFAEEDGPSTMAETAAGGALPVMDQGPAQSAPEPIDEKVLEAKVAALLERWQRTERERRGG
jgi:hypothetical protein